MTSFTAPLIVASAGGQGDGTSVFKVSGNDLTVDGDAAIAGAATLTGALAAGAATFTGTVSAAGHSLAASALAVAVDTTAAAVAGAGANAGAVPASAEFAKITVNGTEFKIALYS
jgi:hypothetical protein